MRALLAVLLSVFTLPADAALMYRFTTTTNVALQQSSSGRVWVDGTRHRIELDPDAGPRTYDVTIFAGGKTTFVNLQNKTYFHEQKGRFAGSSSLWDVPAPGTHELRGKRTVALRTEGAGAPVGGFATVKHVLDVRYRVDVFIQGNSLRADVTAKLELLVVPSLPRLAEGPLIRTTFSEIDEEIARALAPVEGMIVGKDLTISRRLSGGPVVTERTTMVVDELKTIDKVDEKLFAIPAGFRFQEPILGVPGI